MGFISWIIVGAIAGFLANLIMGSREGLLMMVVLGIVGGLVGGFVATSVLKMGSVNGINLESISSPRSARSRSSSWWAWRPVRVDSSTVESDPGSAEREHAMRITKPGWRRSAPPGPRS